MLLLIGNRSETGLACLAEKTRPKAAINEWLKADSYGNEKLIRKWTKSVFFGFFQFYGNENGPDLYNSQIRLSVS